MCGRDLQPPGSTLRLTDVSATASGRSEDAYGVFNNSSSPMMTDVTATASGGRSTIGVFNVNSSPSMTNVTAKASGGNNNIGVDNNNSSLLIRGSTLEASGGNNKALLSFDGGTVRVDNSRLIATGPVIDNSIGTTTRVGASQLEGGPVSGPVTCAGVYDENHGFFASSCP
jgi:hypothetical protein